MPVAPAIPPAAPVATEPKTPVAPENTPSAPPVAGPPKPKLGKGFLQQMQEQAASIIVSQETILMTPELATQLYAAYIEKLKNDTDKVLQATNLGNATIKMNSPEELVICCNSNISLIYAVGNLDAFRDYCRQETHSKDLRVLAELDPAAEKQAPKLQSISKNELFDMMVAQNPMLKQLKDQLRLDLG